jgi:hypothetical protein
MAEDRGAFCGRTYGEQANQYGLPRILFGIAGLIILQPWAMAQSSIDSVGNAEIDAPSPLSDSYTSPSLVYGVRARELR